MYSKRGFGDRGEYRYVLSEQQRGIFGGFFIQEVLKNDASRG